MAYAIGNRILIVLQEPVTYVVGEWSTFNEAVEVMEKFYGLRSTRSSNTNA
jgi:hypothetical protein